MAQFASDNFTGTTGTILSTYNAAWTLHTSYSDTCQLATNRVRASTASTVSAYWHSGTPAAADYIVKADLFTKVNDGGTSVTSVAGRVDTSANTMYLGGYAGSSSDRWEISKLVAGTFTLLGSSPQALADETSFNVQLEMIGTAIKLYKQGSSTATISVTDSSITAAGKAGIRINPGSSISDLLGLHLDNFSADDVVGGAGTSFPFRHSSFQHMLVR